MSLRPTALAACAALCVAVAACSDGAGTTTAVDPSAPSSTVAGVGRLPAEVRAAASGAVIEIDADALIRRPVDEETGSIEALVADRVDGNRLLVIGDSILASTSSRYGGELCAELVPLGWQVEVDAEAGRFVEFGDRVLDRRLPSGGADPADDWDAAVVHLGTNYDFDQANYRRRLEDILTRLAPRPTLLLTVTEYRWQWAQVDEVIAEMAARFDNVIVVDWARAARVPGVLSGDGLHPTDTGQEVLVGLIGAAMGTRAGDEGACLRTQFTDDSAIDAVPAADDGSTGGSSSSSSGSTGSTSGGSSGSTSRGSTSGSSSSGSTSSGSTSGGSASGSSGSSSGGSTTGSTNTSTTVLTTGGSSSGTTSGSTTGGSTTSGSTTSGSTSGGSTTVVSTTGGSTGGSTSGSTTGSTSGGSTSGTTSGGSTTSGTTTGGSTTSGGSTSGSTTGGSTTSGSTTSGTTTGGSTTGGTTGGSTTGGSTTGGSTTGGAATTGGG